MYKVYFNRNLVLFPAQAPTDETRTWVDPDPQTLRKVVADCFDKGKAKIAFLSTTGRICKKYSTVFSDTSRPAEASSATSPRDAS